MFIKQAGNGDWYVARRSSRSGRSGREWYLIKSFSSNIGYIPITKNLYFPKFFVGKRVRIKIEVIG
jgi:hypothetical protein